MMKRQASIIYPAVIIILRFADLLMRTDIATGQEVLGSNMFAYCGNNPVNRVDPTGHSWNDVWEFFKTAISEIGKVMNSWEPAYAGIRGLSEADGPLPFGDIIGTIGAGILTIGAIGYGIYEATQKPAVAITKEEEEDLAVLSSASISGYIYKYHGINPGNLVPTNRDVKTNTGLSFSTIPSANSWRTTIDVINSTGVLIAVHDRPTHVAVYPIGGTLKSWREKGSSSKWTQVLMLVCTKYK